MAKDTKLYLAKLPFDDREALLNVVIEMARQMTGKEPTEDDIAKAREILGADHPKPDARKTRARKRAKPAR